MRLKCYINSRSRAHSVYSKIFGFLCMLLISIKVYTIITYKTKQRVFKQFSARVPPPLAAIQPFLIPPTPHCHRKSPCRHDPRAHSPKETSTLFPTPFSERVESRLRTGVPQARSMLRACVPQTAHAMPCAGTAQASIPSTAASPKGKSYAQRKE